MVSTIATKKRYGNVGAATDLRGKSLRGKRQIQPKRMYLRTSLSYFPMEVALNRRTNVHGYIRAGTSGWTFINNQEHKNTKSHESCVTPRIRMLLRFPSLG